jgi:selenophosphate synthetase-related protein
MSMSMDTDIDMEQEMDTYMDMMMRICLAPDNFANIEFWMSDIRLDVIMLDSALFGLRSGF